MIVLSLDEKEVMYLLNVLSMQPIREALPLLQKIDAQATEQKDQPVQSSD